jgi:hypothetical protein
MIHLGAKAAQTTCQLMVFLILVLIVAVECADITARQQRTLTGGLPRLWQGVRVAIGARLMERTLQAQVFRAPPVSPGSPPSR